MENADIERVARSMCSALGLDPEERVTVGHPDVETPAELAARGPAVYDVALIVARWQTYRGKAAEAIAAKTAAT